MNLEAPCLDILPAQNSAFFFQLLENLESHWCLRFNLQTLFCLLLEFLGKSVS